jgi:hypothetical protein
MVIRSFAESHVQVRGGCHESYHCSLDMCTCWCIWIRKYHCVCEMVASMYAAVETHRQIFGHYQNDLLEIQWMVLSMEGVSWKIFGYLEMHVKYEHAS